MQILPLVGFYWRRHSQIEELLKSSNGDSHVVLDVLSANVPLLKKYFPNLNKDGLLDDAITTLKEVLAPAPVSAGFNRADEGNAG